MVKGALRKSRIVCARYRRGYEFLASMGPRTSIRGNSGFCRPSMSARARLQWGRGLPSAETDDGQQWIDRLALLQWGRGLPSAETRA